MHAATDKHTDNRILGCVGLVGHVVAAASRPRRIDRYEHVLRGHKSVAWRPRRFAQTLDCICINQPIAGLECRSIQLARARVRAAVRGHAFGHIRNRRGAVAQVRVVQTLVGRDRLLYLQTRGTIEVQAHPRADRLAVDASVDDPLHIRGTDRGRGHQQEPRALVDQPEQRLHGLLRGKVCLVEYHRLRIEPTGSLYNIQKKE